MSLYLPAPSYLHIIPNPLSESVFFFLCLVIYSVFVSLRVYLYSFIRKVCLETGRMGDYYRAGRLSHKKKTLKCYSMASYDDDDTVFGHILGGREPLAYQDNYIIVCLLTEIML